MTAVVTLPAHLEMHTRFCTLPFHCLLLSNNISADHTLAALHVGQNQSPSGRLSNSVHCRWYPTSTEWSPSHLMIMRCVLDIYNPCNLLPLGRARKPVSPPRRSKIQEMHRWSFTKTFSHKCTPNTLGALGGGGSLTPQHLRCTGWGGVPDPPTP